jgi:hypothetical protein
MSAEDRSMTAGRLDRERLAKLLGLLGSDYDGEVVAAARQAERLRREAQATWFDILAPALPPPRREREIDSVADAVEFALENAGVLNDWERRFVRSISRQLRPLSEKQRAALARIIDKCRAAAEAAA